MKQFPRNFLWGAAASAYQVEGDNSHCDWWEWEINTGKQRSLNACCHYELYKQDFDLAKSLNHNCHRLSIEWSRIEQEQGVFLPQVIEHYKDVINSLKERGLEPIVTLHHFTNPIWLAKIGGWLNPKAQDYFLSYVQKIVDVLAKNVRYWITINEPMVYLYHAYILGAWPPQEKSFSKARIVEKNMANAHISAYRLIHNMYKEKQLPAPYVSIAKNMQAFVACNPRLINKAAVYLRDKFYNFSLIEKLIRAGTLDFIGVNYYNRGLVEVEKWRLSNLLLDNCPNNHHPLEKNSLGWDIYPRGLYDLLIKLKKYNLDIMITENGICTEDDSQRSRYIFEHLKSVYRAIEQGVKVSGYIYWSLLDNFEWDKGYSPRFGLVEVDYNTYKRSIRASAKEFSLICKTGIMD